MNNQKYKTKSMMEMDLIALQRKIFLKMCLVASCIIGIFSCVTYIGLVAAQ